MSSNDISTISPGMTSAILAFWQRLSNRRRMQFFALIGLSLIASIAEVASLAMLFPLLVLLTTPQKALDNAVIRHFADLLNVADGANLAFAALVSFIVASVVAGVVRFVVLVANNKYTFGLAAELSEQTYRKCLYQPYSVQLQRSSSALIDGVIHKTLAVTTNVVSQLLILMTSTLIGTSILLTLFVTDPVVAGITGGTFTLIYTIITLTVRKQLKQNGETIARQSIQITKALQEGLGGIRDVLIDGTQNVYVQVFRTADRPIKAALARNAVITGSPRFIVETLGMVLIATLAFLLMGPDGGAGTAIATLGVLALGAQRLMPMLQQSYAAVATIRGTEASLREVIELLDQPDEPTQSGEPIRFNRDIQLADVEFQYPLTSAPVLRKVDLVIAKGSRIGLYGATGGGKSTTLDVIMGLLSPTGGRLLVDGIEITEQRQVSWRRHVAHVPQSIYLSDGTIADNIAFGTPPGQIDMERVRTSAASAHIAATIESWPDGYNTRVGERGVRISGGQRQRIGVARALYKRADLIILDEATSALDNKTESAVIAAIESLGSDVTIIMVAHRLSTLKNCDWLVEIEGGTVKRIGSYEDIVV